MRDQEQSNESLEEASVFRDIVAIVFNLIDCSPDHSHLQPPPPCSHLQEDPEQSKRAQEPAPAVGTAEAGAQLVASYCVLFFSAPVEESKALLLFLGIERSIAGFPNKNMSKIFIKKV